MYKTDNSLILSDDLRFILDKCHENSVAIYI